MPSRIHALSGRITERQQSPLIRFTRLLNGEGEAHRRWRRGIPVDASNRQG